MSKELSPELKAPIEQEAADFADKKELHLCAYRTGLKEGYIAGATEYAPYKVKLEQAKSIIERIVMDHDLGLEMSITFYREIKTFLDGK